MDVLIELPLLLEYGKHLILLYTRPWYSLVWYCIWSEKDPEEICHRHTSIHKERIGWNHTELDNLT